MRLLLGVMAAVGMAAAMAQSAQAVAINVYGDAEVPDSGLLSNTITPGFAAYETALGISPLDTISFTSVGSGAAITAAESASNNIDAVLVNAPSLEAPFADGDYATDLLGRSLYYTDDVIVGPTGDPAGVATFDPHNAVGAFEAIAAEGQLHSDVTFISRADASGTNVKEQQIWGQASSTLHPGTGTVVTQHAFNCWGSDATRAEPATSSTGTLVYPSWFAHNSTSSPPGQAANVDDANNCDATAYPDGGCYTIVDRATWDSETALGNTGNLMIVSDMNSSVAPGGATELTDPFHGYVVASAASAHKAAAERLLTYLTSTTFLNSIVPLAPDFIESAYPEIENSTMPTHKTGAGRFSFSAQLFYTPVVAPIVGMPVNLQSASSSGGPWTLVDTQSTNSSGVVSFPAVRISANTFFRFDMGFFNDFDAAVRSRLSPNDNAGLNAGGVPGEVTCC